MSLVLCVIPARYASTRFPGKALATLIDRPMIEEVWRRASGSERIDRLVVAADDARILDAARGFGAEAVQTSTDHPSGTDRVAEVVQTIGESFDIIVNLQGDEPLITPSSLDRLIAAFDGPNPPQMATLSEPIDSIDELFDPNVVKLVQTEEGRALYFSRSPIPYRRGSATELETDFRAAIDPRKGGLLASRKHQGVYAYSRDTLLALTRTRPSSLEIAEGLEQLRALQMGHSIQVVQSDFRSVSVDTPADLERVAKILAKAEAC